MRIFLCRVSGKENGFLLEKYGVWGWMGILPPLLFLFIIYLFISRSNRKKGWYEREEGGREGKDTKSFVGLFRIFFVPSRRRGLVSTILYLYHAGTGIRRARKKKGIEK